MSPSTTTITTAAAIQEPTMIHTKLEEAIAWPLSCATFVFCPCKYDVERALQLTSKLKVEEISNPEPAVTVKVLSELMVKVVWPELVDGGISVQDTCKVVLSEEIVPTAVFLQSPVFESPNQTISLSLV